MNKAGILITVLVACAFACAHAAWASERPAWWEQLQTEATKDGYRLIDPSQLKALCDEGEVRVLLDVRPSYEFEEGHLPGAVNMEFDLGDRQALNEKKRALFEEVLGPDKQILIVIYCRGFR